MTEAITVEFPTIQVQEEEEPVYKKFFVGLLYREMRMGDQPVYFEMWAVNGQQAFRALKSMFPPEYENYVVSVQEAT